MSKMPPYLILCYARTENFDKLFDYFHQIDETRLYFAIDYSEKYNEKIFEYIFEFSKNSKHDVFFISHQNHVGISINLLTSLNLIFQREESLIIIEDDCLPNIAFDYYMRNALLAITTNENINIVSGFNPLKNSETDGCAMVTTVPMTWGWGVTKKDWEWFEDRIYSVPFEFSTFKSFLKFDQTLFWHVGSLRSNTRLIDAWDLMFAFVMHVQKKFTLLPPFNLIENVGNDEFATHTNKSEDIRIRIETTNINKSQINHYLDNLSCSHDITNQINEKFIMIRIRHLISPLLTFNIRKMVDRFIFCRNNGNNLKQEIQFMTHELMITKLK